MFIYVTRTGYQGTHYKGYIGRTVPNPYRLVDDIEYVCEAPDNDRAGRALAAHMNQDAALAVPLPVMAQGVRT